MTIETIAIISLIVNVIGGGWIGWRTPALWYGGGLVSLVALIVLVLVLFDRI